MKAAKANARFTNKVWSKVITGFMVILALTTIHLSFSEVKPGKVLAEAGSRIKDQQSISGPAIVLPFLHKDGSMILPLSW
jgi:hypothetical protein